MQNTINMKKHTFILLAIILSFSSCKKNGILPDPKPINLTAKAKKLVKADNRFGFELLNRLADTGYAENNFMISPLSISQALSMAYNGAAGSTKTAFDNTMHFDGMSLQDINQSQKELVSALLPVDPKVALTIANSVWYSNSLQIKDEFVQRNETYYNSQVKALNFNSNASVEKINNWVNEKTNGKITEIVKTLNPLDRLVLINAIYFKGNWRNKFHEEETAPGEFYTEDGEKIIVDMMKTTGDFVYYENVIFNLLEMPYGRKNFSMVVLLPKEGYRVSDIMDSLSAENWQKWLNESYPVEDVPVVFPKFKFSYEQSLVKVLKELGLETAFNKTNADFSGINEYEQLFISNVLHKTFIKVDETGTEAAAATSVVFGTTSVGPGNPFVADHPFVFIIKEKYTQAILFSGVLSNPNQE